MVNVNATIEELSIKLTIPHKILKNLLLIRLIFGSSDTMACSFTLSVENNSSEQVQNELVSVCHTKLTARPIGSSPIIQQTTGLPLMIRSISENRVRREQA